MAGDGRGRAVLEPRRTVFHAVPRRPGRRRRQRLPRRRPVPGDVPVHVRRADAARRRVSARAADQHVAGRPDRGPRRRHDRGRDRAAPDRGRRPWRHRLGRGLAGLPDRRHPAADLHDRRARGDRLAPGARVAADRREHAAQRDRRLDLRLPDRDRQLPGEHLARKPVAGRRGPAGRRRVDVVAAAGAPAYRGLAAGAGARAVAADRARGCSCTATSTEG